MEDRAEILLLHDGELSDVAGLLDDLGIAWVEGRAAQADADWAGVVIGTPLHLLRSRVGRVGAARVAVCDRGGRTAERKLQHEGVDFILRRPVHPTALRLLILHLVYRGPERRRLRRVSAALPVKFRAGLRSRAGLLLEFSVGGCQLLTPKELPSGQRLSIRLPEELGLGRKLKVPGTVVRSTPAAGSPGEFAVAVDFGELDPDVRQRLAAGVVARARQVPPPAPIPHTEPSTEAAEAPGERRRQPRGSYTKPVHARAGEEQLVLMGTNLSTQGMHVDAVPGLAVGTRLKLDLYGHGDIPPLRMEATIQRDDGERGLYLVFENLWPGAPALLERLIKTLPLVAAGDETGLVVTEVIERS